jgi:hypothetical protein
VNLKKQIKESDPKTGGKSKDPKNPKKTGKKGKEGKNWWYTKAGDTIKCPESGATLKWCPHHDTGAYMPADHNHKEWAENKRKHQLWSRNAMPSTSVLKGIKGIKRSPTAVNARTRNIPASCSSALLFASHS